MKSNALYRNAIANVSHLFARKCLPALLLLVLACIAAAPAMAQSYVPPVVSTAVTTLFSNGSTYINPGQVAVDKAGNVFYINHISPYSLYEIPYTAPAVTTTAPALLVTGLGQYNSNGLFVDPKGNLWIANGNGTAGIAVIPAGTNGIPNTAAIPAGGEAYTVLAATNCTAAPTVPCVWGDGAFATNITGYYVQPSSLVVDASGNVYFVDFRDNTSLGNYNRIVKFNISTSPGTGTLLADNLTTNANATLALDGAGNLYYADSASGGGNGHVSLVSGGALTMVGTTATLTSALISSATGVSSDQYGNLYIHSTTQISEVPFEGTALNFADEFGIVSGLSTTMTYGGAVDSNGNIYYASNTNIMQVQVNGYNFGNINVGTLVTSTSASPAPSLTLYFNAAASGISSYFPTGSPTSNTYPQYLQSFPWSGTKSFSGGASFTASQSGTITMNFQPIHPGLLKGSFTPRSNGVDIAIINLQGNGVGPQPLFIPGTPSQLFNSSGTGSNLLPLNAPTGLAVDTYGDIFVADSGNSKVVVDCLATTTVTVAGSGTGGATNSFCGNSPYLGAVTALSTGFTSPAGIALDGANNLYVVDRGANLVKVINGVGLTATTLVSATAPFGGTVLSGPKGIAVDGYTNIFIADTGNNRIVKAHQFGATATDNVVYIPSTTTFGGTVLSGPTGIAVDSAGNLFIADTGNNRIVEYTRLGVASVISAGSLTLSAPTGVAVYPSGSLVVTDATHGVMLLSGSSSQVLSFGTSYTTTNAQAVALDLAGNIYLSNTTGNQILELNVTSPQTLAYPTTNTGASSAPTTTQVVNGGSASLVLSGLSSSTVNYTIASSSTCTSTSTVTSAGACNLVTQFTPSPAATPGTLTGSITLTDNQLSYTLVTTTSNETASFATSGTQTLNLTGTAVAPIGTTPQTITFPAPASPVTYGVTPITLSATASSGRTVTFAVISGPASVTGNALTITGAGTVVVGAYQPGDSTYAPATPVSQTILVNPAAQTITFPAPASPVTYPASPVTLSATASSGLAVTFSVTSGPGTISGNTLTVTGAGTIVVAANQAGNTNYAPAPAVSQSIVVNQAAQTITFTAPATPIKLGVDPVTIVTLVATSSSTLPVTFTVTSGPATINGAALKITGAGTVVITASQAGNVNYLPAPPVSQSIMVTSFTIAVTPSTLNVAFGSPQSATVTVAALYGFSDTITFGCDNLPAGGICIFTPPSFKLTGTSPMTTTMTVYGTTSGASLRRGPGYFMPIAAFAFAGCLFGFRKRRHLRSLLVVALALVGLGMATGCGANSQPAAGTPTTVTLFAVSGELKVSTTFTLTLR